MPYTKPFLSEKLEVYKAEKRNFKFTERPNSIVDTNRMIAIYLAIIILTQELPCPIRFY